MIDFLQEFKFWFTYNVTFVCSFQFIHSATNKCLLITLTATASRHTNSFRTTNLEEVLIQHGSLCCHLQKGPSFSSASVGCGWPLVPPLPDSSVMEIVSSCCVTPQLPKSFTNLDGLMKIRNIETHSCLSTVYQYNEISWLLLGCDECKLDVFCLPCIEFLRQRKGRQSM